VEAEDRRGRIAWLPVAGAFAAGLLVMFGFDLVKGGDKPAEPAGSADVAAATTEPGVTPASAPAVETGTIPAREAAAPANTGAGQFDRVGADQAGVAAGAVGGAAAGGRDSTATPATMTPPTEQAPAVAESEPVKEAQSQPKTTTTRTGATTAAKPDQAEQAAGTDVPAGATTRPPRKESAKKESAKKESAKKESAKKEPAKKEPGEKEPGEKTPPEEKKPTGIVDPFAS
jgi:hypothetical protein